MQSTERQVSWLHDDQTVNNIVKEVSDNMTVNSTNSSTSDKTDSEMESIHTNTPNINEVVEECIDLNDDQLIESTVNELETFYQHCSPNDNSKAKDVLNKHKTVQRLFNIVRHNKTLANFMHVSGKLLLPGIDIESKKVLMDTGALHGSYVSTDFVKRYRKYLNGHILAATGSVRFGNDDNIYEVNEVLILPIAITCSDTRQCTKLNSVFTIIDLSSDFIIGLPDLVSDLSHIFVKRFTAAAKYLQSQKDKKTLVLGREVNGVSLQAIAANHNPSQKRTAPMSPSIGMHSRLITEVQSVTFKVPSEDNKPTITDVPNGTLLEPWENNENDEAPEDEHGQMEQQDFTHSMLDPHSLNYMTNNEYDEALKKYHDEIAENRPPPLPGERDRIDPIALAHKPFMSLLKEPSTIDRFVPKEWSGIKMDPIQLRVDPDMPKERKINSRTPAVSLMDKIKTELTRLCKYMYTPSKSPIVSPMVPAEKKTPPYVRLCGDYRWVNKYLLLEHAHMPDVKDQLMRLKGFNHFVELDLTNSFHQFPLSEESSELLTLLTMFGALRPKFMPEGIKPASSILQNQMSKIFNDMSEYVIVIFDNIVIGAEDMDQLTQRFRSFIQRCTEFNLYLKITKSYFGVSQLDFFGYEVTGKGFRLSDDKRSAVGNIEFPADKMSRAAKVERIQQFLGLANFHRPLYVPVDNKPSWVELTTPLYDMTTKSFDWNRHTWTLDYIQAFKDLQTALIDTTTLFFPDFNLPFLLQTDASMHGIGGVLFQIKMEGGSEVRQPIGTVSQKFSGPATRWSTFKQEAYAIFRCVEKLEHLLRGKDFIIETDHSNLQYIEKSKVAILNRWRLYLQTHNITKIRHIKGKHNVYADCLSRGFNTEEDGDTDNESDDDDSTCSELDSLYSISEIEEFENEDIDDFYSNVELEKNYEDELDDIHTQALNHVADLEEDSKLNPDLHKRITSYVREYPKRIEKYDEMIETVHGKSNLHFGEDITWQRLNHFLPGHGIPRKYIQRYIDYCAGCQKTNTHVKDYAMPPEEKVLTCNHRRHRIGIDLLQMGSEPDSNGNKYLHVIVNHFTKFVYVYPSASKSATAAANAILSYRAIYGPVLEVTHDPGSDYTSKTVEELARYLSIHQRISLVDRHESNGVEPFNNQIRRHIQAMTIDNGFVKDWSDPTVIAIIINNINSIPRKSTNNFSAFQLTYGLDVCAKSYKLPDPMKTDSENEYVVRLTQIINKVNQASYEFQKKHKEDMANKNKPYDKNKFQPGDLVLAKDRKRESKSIAPGLGPYEVIEQNGNDVELLDLVKDKRIKSKHITELKPFFYDDKEKAIEAARSDNSEFEIVQIHSYYGNPYNRSTLGFKVEFNDGTITDDLCLTDIAHTAKLDEFINENKELQIIAKENESARIANARRKMFMETTVIDDTLYKEGTKLFVDIRTREIFGALWYDQITLEDKREMLYLVPATIISKPKRINRKHSIEIQFENKIDVTDDTNKQYTVSIATDKITIDVWLLHYHCYLGEELEHKQHKFLKCSKVNGRRTATLNHIDTSLMKEFVIVSQNVISFMPFCKKNGLNDLIQEHSPDIIVLQETKLNDKNRSVALEQILPNLGYSHVVSTEASNAGVLIASKTPIKSSSIIIPGRALAVRIGDVDIVGVYLKLVSERHDLDYRVQQDKVLLNHLESIKGKNILIGDINAINNPAVDIVWPIRLRKALRYPCYEDRTNKLHYHLQLLHYKDLHYYLHPNGSDKHYTTHPSNSWKGFHARVDYIYLSKEMNLSQCQMETIDSKHSDHSTLKAKINLFETPIDEMNAMLNFLIYPTHDLNVIHFYDSDSNEEWLFPNQIDLDTFLGDRTHQRRLRTLRNRNSTNSMNTEINNESIEMDSLDPTSNARTNLLSQSNTTTQPPIVAYPVDAPVIIDNATRHLPNRISNPIDDIHLPTAVDLTRDPEHGNPDQPTHCYWCIRYTRGRPPVIVSDYYTALQSFISPILTTITGHVSYQDAVDQGRVRLPDPVTYAERLERTPEPIVSLPPVPTDQLAVIRSPYLVSHIDSNVIESVGEDLMTLMHIQCGQIIGHFNGRQLPVRHLNQGGHSNRYLLILNDQTLLDCEEQANANPCRCKMSKSNDAVGLYDTRQRRMLQIDDNNAAYHYDSDNNAAILYAVRDINVNEIILWCYDAETLSTHVLGNSPPNDSFPSTFASPRVAVSRGIRRFLQRVDQIEITANDNSDVEQEPSLAFVNDTTHSPLLQQNNVQNDTPSSQLLQLTPNTIQSYEQSINESKLDEEPSPEPSLHSQNSNQDIHLPDPPTVNYRRISPRQELQIERNHQRARIRRRSLQASRQYEASRTRTPIARNYVL